MYKCDACLFVKQGLTKIFLSCLHFHMNSEAANHYHSHLGFFYFLTYTLQKWFTMNL